MSTLTERKRLAESLAQSQVMAALAPPEQVDYLHGTTTGLNVAANVIGISARQQGEIRHAALMWAAHGCPGRATSPPACRLDCPRSCRAIPLAPRHWR